MADRGKFEASDAAKAKLRAFNAQQRDWYGKCRICGAELFGSLKELNEHRHGEPEPTDSPTEPAAD